MSFLRLNQSELNALKQKAQTILKELQMNCDFDYENYHDALNQLTAIDGWTESQSTDGGYAEGHDRYASQEQRVEEMKARLDQKKAEATFFEWLMILVFDKNYLDKIQRNILDIDYIKVIALKHGLIKVTMPSIYSQLNFNQAFRLYMHQARLYPCSVWELREILAWFKHNECCNLKTAILTSFSGVGFANTSFYLNQVMSSFANLAQLERFEQVVTLGMLDLEFGNALEGKVNYMLNHDFGEDVGIDFKKLRYEKAQAQKAELDAELRSLMGLK